MKQLTKKYTPQIAIGYNCPSCIGIMILTAYNSTPDQYWYCNECKKTYTLSFQEVKK